MYASELSEPFFVSTARRNDEDKEEVDDLRFRTLEDARGRFEELVRDPELFVYLGEIGILANRDERLVFDHMTFDTNDYDWWMEHAPLNMLNRRGFGRGWEYDAYVTPYQSLADLNCHAWRLN